MTQKLFTVSYCMVSVCDEMALRSAIIISSIFVGYSHQYNGGCGISDGSPHGSTIFKGEEVPPNKYPWQVKYR